MVTRLAFARSSLKTSDPSPSNIPCPSAFKGSLPVPVLLGPFASSSTTPRWHCPPSRPKREIHSPWWTGPVLLPTYPLKTEQNPLKTGKKQKTLAKINHQEQQSPEGRNKSNSGFCKLQTMQLPQPPPSPFSTTNTPAAASKDNTKATISIILATSLFSILFIFSLSSSSSSSSSTSLPIARARPDPYLFPTRQPTLTQIPSDPIPPSIAYLISGSKGDSARILRLLYATYHPKNQYLLHLDLSASQTERDRLALTVQKLPLFRAALNVNVIGKADFAYPKGSSPISATLHGAAILLRLSKKWDWFVSLGAGDYPLVTQDDLLHIFSYLPKDLNFINHTSYIGWRDSRRLKPIIVDPGLYLSERSDVFYATQKRDLPMSFRLFSGFPFYILSRNFIDHCILGTDNLPRILLMYLSNTPSSLTNYFPTILCNTPQFNRTVINHNLQYATFEKPFKQVPRMLNSSEYDAMIQSGAAFAAQFRTDDPVLDRIDKEILGRSPGKVVPGGWCLDRNGTCSVWGDADILRPGPGASRIEKCIIELLSNGEFRSHQCIVG